MMQTKPSITSRSERTRVAKTFGVKPQRLKGKCYNVSKFVAVDLRLRGIKAHYVEGTVFMGDSIPHAWVEIGDKIIDATWGNAYDEMYDPILRVPASYFFKPRLPFRRVYLPLWWQDARDKMLDELTLGHADEETDTWQRAADGCPYLDTPVATATQVMVAIDLSTMLGLETITDDGKFTPVFVDVLNKVFGEDWRRV
jgi:hypothetical protein